MMFTLRRALHRLACRFGWHIGGNLPFGEDGRFSRCLWCGHESQYIGGAWRDYIRPPRPVVRVKSPPSEYSPGKP